MKIDLSDPNQPTIDAADLAGLFDLDPSQVQPLMRAGKIPSRLETGIDKDAGRFRLTFTYANKRVRLSCDSVGNVSSTVRTPVGPLDLDYDTDHR